MRTRKSLEQQISSLPEVDGPALLDLYKRLYSKSPSPHLLREHIELAVTLKLQKQLTAKLQAKMMQVLADPARV